MQYAEAYDVLKQITAITNTPKNISVSRDLSPVTHKNISVSRDLSPVTQNISVSRDLSPVTHRKRDVP